LVLSINNQNSNGNIEWIDCKTDKDTTVNWLPQLNIIIQLIQNNRKDEERGTESAAGGVI